MSVPKSGVKTSEFWMTVLAQVMSGLAFGFGQLQNSEWAQVVSTVGSAALSVLSIFGYQASRAKVKSAADGF